MKDEFPVTVVTVCYNSEETIGRTFESLLNQTYKNFEYIVIDGGSTDRTLDIIKEFEGKFEGCFKYVSEKDGGIYDAMNKGILLSSGSYIGLLNSDDWYENNTVEEVVRNIKNNPEVDIFYGFIRVIKKGREYMVRRNNYDFIAEGSGLIQHPTCFIKRKAYEDVGLYDTKYRVCADQDLILRMVLSGKKYLGINSVLTNFSQGGITDNFDATYEVLKFKYNNKIISRSAYLRSFVFSGIKRVLKKVVKTR
ncbi:glycosyltransferase family 2 protein [Halomonas alkalisoli]|uniref:glycosyltransferase family 2 protein n=1 Tax=Halomonas alkalisoli TaxID=2907158 RepID=UPI001F1C6A25|nr:glycosyltransferase family 2 protein [Halomonas alkalisoli]MCE9681656.1 glycosyltransferase [Halomonas alkalisoli]